jgi:uncharacterized protein YbbC (DUF1343 family)
MGKYLITSSYLFLLLLTGFLTECGAQQNSAAGTLEITPGASRVTTYVPLLKNKRVGIFANHTSMVGNSHVVDTLRKLGVNITVIFGPEHGFRGNADAGEKIGNYTDDKTGLPVISLYGSKRKPSSDDLKNVDVLLFDIQDVGVRFYTYISSLEEFMEAALINGKPLMILDRPNPNGFYVDGPVLKAPYRSFVGMQPIPVVYGMTIGEYAMMMAGEKWLSPKANEKYEYYRKASNSADTPFHFQVIKCLNYTHQSKYELPVKPSPNLPDMGSIYWYSSTCYFEGTALSEGRGTTAPFQIFGHPSLPRHLYAFTPVSTPGSKEPKLKNQVCYGWNLRGANSDILKKVNGEIQLSYLLEAYKLFPEKEKFFLLAKSGKKEDHFFNKLAGNSDLMEQLIAGKSEAEIRKSWEPDLATFKNIRKKYLMYAD